MSWKKWRKLIVVAICFLTFVSDVEAAAALPIADEDRRTRDHILSNRMRRAAQFILKRQDKQGAMNESGYINTDSNMLYAMMGLLAAYDLTKRPHYLAAVAQGCRWLMRVQNPEGDWFLSYRREKDRYLPVLPKSYHSFTAIRGVDTTMALFIHVADQLRQRSADKNLQRQLEQAARRAYRFLLSCNLDDQDGLFWSSYQLEKKKGETTEAPLAAYKLFRVKYASDNAETYLGLRAAARMFHDQSASLQAERLKASFYRFLDPKSGCYAVMLDKQGERKMRPAYARYFATGWSAYLLQDQTMFSRPRAIIADEMKADGSFSGWEGTYVLSTLSFLLAESRERVCSPKTKQAAAFLFSQQAADGGIADDPVSKNTYVNIAGMFLLYLAEELRG